MFYHINGFRVVFLSSLCVRNCQFVFPLIAASSSLQAPTCCFVQKVGQQAAHDSLVTDHQHVLLPLQLHDDRLQPLHQVLVGLTTRRETNDITDHYSQETWTCRAETSLSRFTFCSAALTQSRWKQSTTKNQTHLNGGKWDEQRELTSRHRGLTVNKQTLNNWHTHLYVFVYRDHMFS